MSEKISKEHIGTFYNSVHLGNYEYTEKSLDMPEDKSDSKDEEEIVDPRTKKITKALNHINLFLKDDAN